MTRSAPALIALFLCLGACDLVESSKEDSFARITTGETTSAEALKIMGEPDVRTSKDVLGVQVETWTYTDRRYTYTLILGGSNHIGAGPRVLIAELHPRSTASTE